MTLNQIIQQIQPEDAYQIKYISLPGDPHPEYRFTAGTHGCGHAGLWSESPEPRPTPISAGFIYLITWGGSRRCRIANEWSSTLKLGRCAEDKTELARLLGPEWEIEWED